MYFGAKLKLCSYKLCKNNILRYVQQLAVSYMYLCIGVFIFCHLQIIFFYKSSCTPFIDQF